MTFYLYSIYDPETESFDSRISVQPLDPKNVAEQYRRAFIKMDEKDKAFMEGKKAIYIGQFDDETAKLSQDKILEIFEFKKSNIVSQVNDGEESQDKADA